MEKIIVGQFVGSKHGKAAIIGIEFMPEVGQKEDGIEMSEVWAIDKDRCVFDLDNGH